MNRSNRSLSPAIVLVMLHSTGYNGGKRARSSGEKSEGFIEWGYARDGP